MSEELPPKLTSGLKPGDKINFLKTGLTLNAGNRSVFGDGPRVMYAGEELVLTVQLIQDSYNRYRESWLDIIDDEEAQRARWGDVYIQRGGVPEGTETGTDDGSTMVRRWQKEYAEALEISNPADRRAEISRLAEKYREYIPKSHWSLGSIPAKG